MARILVIEDDADLRDMLVQLLARRGHEAVGAGDGAEGERLFRSRPADLVLTDLLMPGKEGLETIADLRRDFKGVKIIAISGGGRIEPSSYLSAAERMGASRVFTKPIDVTKLLDAVDSLLAAG
jgi:DNA-binding response OmpR family regulator